MYGDRGETKWRTRVRTFQRESDLFEVEEKTQMEHIS